MPRPTPTQRAALLEARHPVLRGLRAENAALRQRLADLTERQRELLHPSLVAKRRLEPLRPAPPGRLEARAGTPTVIHVDAWRLLANRVTGQQDPVIRIVQGDEIWHCHAVRVLGPSTMAEDDVHTARRPDAGAVLLTHAAIDIVR